MMDSNGREKWSSTETVTSQRGVGVVARATPISADGRLPGQREAPLLFRNFLFLAPTCWSVKGSRLGESLWFNEDGGGPCTFPRTAASHARLRGGWEGGCQQRQAGLALKSFQLIGHVSFNTMW